MRVFKLSVVSLCLLMFAQDVLAELTMGVFPRRPAPMTVQLFSPLAEYMEQETGEKVTLRVYKDFASFWNALEAGEMDIVHYNQYHYISSKQFGYEVFASNVEFGKPTISGALSVRSDAGINTVEDLRGKVILFGGGKKAMGSYIAPLAVLKKSGLEPGTDFTVQFAKNPPSAVIAVYNGAAAAAGSGDVILNIGVVKQAVDVDKMKILATSERFSQLPWAVHERLGQDTKDKIRNVMTSLHESGTGSEIVKKAKVDRFVPVDDSDYDPVREIVEFALGEKW